LQDILVRRGIQLDTDRSCEQIIHKKSVTDVLKIVKRRARSFLLPPEGGRVCRTEIFMSVPRPGLREWLSLGISYVFVSFLLISCSNVGGNSANPTQVQVAPSQLHWCGKPVMIFRDEAASAQTSVTPTVPAGSAPTPEGTATVAVATQQPTILTNWSQVEPQLGFAVYLPQMLPQNTCLVSASGTLHDPIFGGSFTIGYLLPDQSSISLAEAPLRSQNRQFQCSPSSNVDSPKAGTPAANRNQGQTILQVCSGVQNRTSIVFSARGSTDYLQHFFNTLQPNINWVPGS
jgi:hypothetical protein